MNQFLWGSLAMAALVAGLLFLRFWKLGGDRLFLFFATAFGILAFQWIVLGVANPDREAVFYVYVLRLAAFVLIIVGIVDKNRRAERSLLR
ncbi:MAG TPA: DUF5985 family protein [Burkholderiales bacterium]|jgi:hypothetical protein|nr:DUF5985 family protein [Burkholderiales bacterium]